MQIEKVPVGSLVLDPTNAQAKRFLDRIKVAEDGCWNFSDIQDHTGYGKFCSLGKTWRAHRWIMWHLGEIDYLDKRCILHNCDNRSCVNPDHLRLGDRYDNAQDIKLRNRTHLIRDPKLGSRNPQSKLNEEDVLSIRDRINAGEKGIDLASEYKVSKTTISEIKSRKIWSHL